jgi:REP element-mobilizing transposase RayT
MPRVKNKQLELADYFKQRRMTSGHGGPRKGAGRRPTGRRQVRHRRRSQFLRLTPAHVTLRVVDGLSSLRKKSLVLEVRKTFCAACERGDFRLVEYSIQDDHLHLIVEAESQSALSRGMMSISARFARVVNRVFERRGRVISGRYHIRLLTSPTQVRNALRYVLLNVRKHYVQRHGYAPPVQIDAASSGSQFDGWSPSSERLLVKADTGENVGVSEAASWLLRIGWRKLGAIDLAAVLGAAGVHRGDRAQAPGPPRQSSGNSGLEEVAG